jgi:hypothetical protein
MAFSGACTDPADKRRIAGITVEHRVDNLVVGRARHQNRGEVSEPDSLAVQELETVKHDLRGRVDGDSTIDNGLVATRRAAILGIIAMQAGIGAEDGHTLRDREVLGVGSSLDQDRDVAGNPASRCQRIADGAVGAVIGNRGIVDNQNRGVGKLDLFRTSHRVSAMGAADRQRCSAD